MQQQSEPSTLSFGDSEPSIIRSGAFLRAARVIAARFGRGTATPIEQPFHDSDFEVEPDFFGRPLGEH